MARGLGAFAAGLAGGAVSGWKMGLEAQEAEERKKTADLQRESIGLQITKEKDDAAWRTGRQKLITDAMTEPVLGEDDAGNFVETGRRKRQPTFGDTLDLYERLGAHDMAHGKLDPAHGIDLKNKIGTLEREGSFDAYRAFKQSGNINDAVRMFDSRGQIKFDPESGIHESEAKDQITGMPYTKYLARTVDGKTLTFDPLEFARLAGGSKGVLDEIKQSFESRKVAARESAEATRAAREENRAAYGERRADQRDRQLDIMDKRVSAMGTGRSEEKPLTTAQQMRNLSIDGARKIVSGMSPEEIKRKTAKFSSTGRENADYDPQLAKRMALANSRKYGADDEFDAQADQPAIPKEPASVESRFTADTTMRGNRLGKQTPQGREVFDPSGKLIGHWN